MEKVKVVVEAPVGDGEKFTFKAPAARGKVMEFLKEMHGAGKLCDADGDIVLADEMEAGLYVYTVVYVPHAVAESDIVQMSNLASEMEHSIEAESYLPSHMRRKSSSKTVPLKGGRTADYLISWETFSNEVMDFWQGVRAPLANIQVHPLKYPYRAYPERARILISDESEVRGACFSSIFGIVNLACEELGFKEQINASSSKDSAKSKVDVAAFLMSNHNKELEVSVTIEVKGPRQLEVDNDQHVCQIFESMEKDSVLKALSQIYYYMITEEVQFGVLCSKEQHIFFMRSADPSDKTLCVSKTFNHADVNPSIRMCYLYLLAKARDGETVFASQVPETQPSQKWICVPPSAPAGISSAGGRGRAAGGSNNSRGRGTAAGGSNNSRERGTASGGSNNRRRGGSTRSWRNGSSGRNRRQIQMEEDRVYNDVELDWLCSLEEFEINHLHLGKAIKNGAKCIVRVGIIENVDVYVKIYEFFENYDGLSSFKTEIQAYEILHSLQGLIVPKLISYGTTWGQCVGFIAIEKAGVSLKDYNKKLPPSYQRSLERCFSMIHKYGLVHNDISSSNIVISDCLLHPVKVIDFGNSVLNVQKEDLIMEANNVSTFCAHHGASRCGEDGSTFDFNVNED